MEAAGFWQKGLLGSLRISCSTGLDCQRLLFGFRIQRALDFRIYRGWNLQETLQNQSRQSLPTLLAVLSRHLAGPAAELHGGGFEDGDVVWPFDRLGSHTGV